MLNKMYDFCTVSAHDFFLSCVYIFVTYVYKMQYKPTSWILDYIFIDIGLFINLCPRLWIFIDLNPDFWTIYNYRLTF